MTALLSLFAAQAGVSAQTAVEIDLTKTGPEINDHIYGQFIEHLGRCIYGGIWAEMLEDRKFYFDVTADYAPYKGLVDSEYPVVGASPWEIVGDASGVSMTKEDVFVGDHSVLVKEKSGIRQNDLGVAAGRDYTGYIWVKSAGKNASEIAVSLSFGDSPADSRSVSLKVKKGDFVKIPFAFKAGASTDHARLSVFAAKGDVVIGTISLMPADNVKGMRADTLALLKELNGSIYRWPGGNFTSGYDWHDGIGDRDRRPPRKNPAWTGVEHNDFGTDEFIEFCRQIGTEPLIAANAGFGDAYCAAQWVEYCNGAEGTLAGGWRAANGHKGPYNVQYWCVGNEMFGTWQLGYIRLSQYELKHNIFADAMWKVDSSIKLVAVGDLDTNNVENDPETKKSGEKWSHGMLANCADRMNFISEHFYRGRLPWDESTRYPLSEAVTQLKEGIRQKADGHRALQAELGLKQKVPVSVDEWNYWHREYTFGELGCPYDLADGLGVAEGLHEYYRSTDIIFMAFYAQTVNVIGAIKTSRTEAQMETTGLVLSMYRAHFGKTPVVLAKDYAPLDVTAALSADGKSLTVGVVNPTGEKVTLALALAGGKVTGKAARWTVTGTAETDKNVPGAPRAVNIAEEPGIDATVPVEIPALSANVISIPIDR
jgi:alpha-N-arabinofuranosidase